MNINGKQIALLVGSIVSVLMIAGPQLTDMVGPGWAKWIVSAAGLANLLINSIMAALTGTISQDQKVKDVLAMQGVESIDVNKRASPALAALAVDPAQPRIAAIPKDLQAVAETANKAGG